MKKAIISPYIDKKEIIMSKTIELGIAERIQLIGVFNQVKGDVETLQAVLEDVKEVSISEDEKKAINFREVKNEEGITTSFAWDESKAKSITLSEKSASFVLKFIENAKELSISDAPLLEVNRKLKENE
jgi:hypothetical protein